MSATEAPGSGELRMARAVSHPLRLLVFSAYSLAVTSPSKIARTLGMPVNLVSYHTRVLVDAGLLELVRVEPRRGAHEHFYRATGRAEIEDADWARLTVSARRAIMRRGLEVIWAEATDSLPAGGMDDRLTHISRSVLRLDDRGRTELATLLRETIDAVAEIERASISRVGDHGSPAELVMLQFTPAPGQAAAERRTRTASHRRSSSTSAGHTPTAS